MKRLEENKRLLILIVVLIISLLLLFQLSTRNVIFGFVSFILVFLLSGLGLAKIFEKVFVYVDLIGYLTNSLVLGILFNTLLLVFLGLFGVVYSNTFIAIFFGVSISLNILYAILNKTGNKDFFKPSFEIVDIVWGLFFLLVFFFIISICLENYYPNWDSFNLWAVDAKFLFENRVLRDVSFDILKNAAYSSFYPFFFFLSYVFWGGVYEQFASLVTVLFAFLSFLLLFNHIRLLKASIVKSFSYLSLTIVLFAFLSLQNILVSLYADVFCSFLVLLFAYILFESKVEKEDYFRRLFLLSNISFLLYLTKEPYWTITLVLFMVWLVYDWRAITSQFPGILKNWKFLGVLMLQLILGFCFIKYLSQFDSRGVVDSLSVGINSLRSYILYISDTFKLISEELPFIFFLYGAITLFLFTHFFKTKKILFLLVLFLGLFFVPEIFYVIRMKNLLSMSLLRYISLGFFLFPYIFSFVEIKQKYKVLQEVFLVGISMLAGAYFLLEMFLASNQDFLIEPHSGKYCDVQEGSCNIAGEVLSRVEEDDKVLLVDKVGTGVGNMALPGIYIRYYLFENSSGGQYSSSVETFPNLVREISPDYLLIVGYDGYWEDCNSFLAIDETYLIPIEKFLYDNETCPIEEGLYELNL